MSWSSAPQKPAEFAETRLVDAILEERFPVGSNLPAERELAGTLGITRPTLREALQRMARDGWIEIRQGKPTRVRNYWQEGNLGVLGAIARRPEHQNTDFIPNLLSVRQLIAPAYTRLAIQNDPQAIYEVLSEFPELDDKPEVFASYDWKLHHNLTVVSGNPVFTLILNGFNGLYQQMGELYFASKISRGHSRSFYTMLLAAVQDRDPIRAGEITNQIMGESLAHWRRISNLGGSG